MPSGAPPAPVVVSVRVRRGDEIVKRFAVPVPAGSTVAEVKAMIQARVVKKLGEGHEVSALELETGDELDEEDDFSAFVAGGVAPPVVAVLAGDEPPPPAPPTDAPPQPPAPGAAAPRDISISVAFAGSSRVHRMTVDATSMTLAQLRAAVADAAGLDAIPDGLPLPGAEGEGEGEAIQVFVKTGSSSTLTVDVRSGASCRALVRAAAAKMGVPANVLRLNTGSKMMDMRTGGALTAFGVSKESTLHALVRAAPPPGASAAALRVAVDLFTASAPIDATAATDAMTLDTLGLLRQAGPDGSLDLFATARVSSSGAHAGDERSTDASMDSNFRGNADGWVPTNVDTGPVPRRAAHIALDVNDVVKSELCSALRVVCTGDGTNEAVFAGLLARLRAASGFPPAAVAIARLRENMPITEPERCAIATSLWSVGRSLGLERPELCPRVVLAHLAVMPSVCLVPSETGVAADADGSKPGYEEDSLADLAGQPDEGRQADDPAGLLVLPPAVTDGDGAYGHVQLTCNLDASERLVDPVRVDAASAGLPADRRGFFRGKVFSRASAVERLPGGGSADAKWAGLSDAHLVPAGDVAQLLACWPEKEEAFAWTPPRALSDHQRAVLAAVVGGAAAGAGGGGPGEDESTEDRARDGPLGAAPAWAAAEGRLAALFSAEGAARAATVRLATPEDDGDALARPLYGSDAAGSLRLRAVPPEQLSAAPTPSITFTERGTFGACVGLTIGSDRQKRLYDPMTALSSPFDHALLGTKVKSLPAAVAEFKKTKLGGARAVKLVRELCAVLVDKSNSMNRRGFPEEADPLGEERRRKDAGVATDCIAAAIAGVDARMGAARAAGGPSATHRARAAAMACTADAIHRAELAASGREPHASRTVNGVRIRQGRHLSADEREEHASFDESLRARLAVHPSLGVLRWAYREVSGSASKTATLLSRVLPYALMDQLQRMERLKSSLHRYKTSIGRWAPAALLALAADPDGLFGAATDAAGIGGASASAAPDPDMVRLATAAAPDAVQVRGFIASRGRIGEGAPASLRCPISGELMTLPVKWGDGNTYQRSSIEAFIASKRSTSGSVRSPADNSVVGASARDKLTVDTDAMRRLRDFVTEHPLGFVEGDAGDGLAGTPVVALEDGATARSALAQRNDAARVMFLNGSPGDGTKKFAVYVGGRTTLRHLTARVRAAHPALDVPGAAGFYALSRGRTQRVSAGDLLRDLVDDEGKAKVARMAGMGHDGAPVHVMPVREWPAAGDDQTKATLHWLPEQMHVLDLKVVQWVQRGMGEDRGPWTESLWCGFKKSGDGWIKGTLLDEEDTLRSRRAAISMFEQDEGSFCQLGESDCSWGEAHGRTSGPKGVLVCCSPHYEPHDTPDKVSRIFTVKELFHSFINRLIAYDEPLELSLAVFGSGVDETCAFTPLFEDFRTNVSAIVPDGDTALIDAIGAAADRLKARRDEEHPEASMRILVLSDGKDTSSSACTPLTAAKSLQSKGITLDAVVIGSEVSEDLFSLAKCSGGYFFNPETLEESQRLVEMEVFLSTMQRPDRPDLPSVTSSAELRRFRDRERYPANSCADDSMPPMRGHPEMEVPSARVEAAAELAEMAALAAETAVGSAGKGGAAVLRASMEAAIKGSTGGLKHYKGKNAAGVLGGMTTTALTGHRQLQRLRRLRRELQAIRDAPHPMIDVFPSEANPGFWKLLVHGPPVTPYAGGSWLAYIDMPADFPRAPPVVRFVTPIKHVNVSPYGKVCHTILGTEWAATRTITEVVQCIHGLLLSPQTDSPVDTVLAMKWHKERAAYDTVVSRHTTRFATGVSKAEWEARLLKPKP